MGHLSLDWFLKEAAARESKELLHGIPSDIVEIVDFFGVLIEWFFLLLWLLEDVVGIIFNGVHTFLDTLDTCYVHIWFNH